MASLAERLNISAGKPSPKNGNGAARPPMASRNSVGRAPSAAKVNKQQTRATASPYAKSPPAPVAASAGVDGDKWSHDLFESSSSLYDVQLNTNFSKPRNGGLFSQAMGKIAAPSPSLRPFGSATPPVASPPLVSPAAAAPSGDLFERLGGGAAKGQAARPAVSQVDERKARAREIALKEEQAAAREAERRIARQQAAEAEKEAKRLREEEEARRVVAEQEELSFQLARQQEEQMKQQQAQQQALLAQQRAAQQPQSTLLVVRNLVEGTTAEDVQAAFADFGKILSAKMDRMNTNDGSVDIMVEFENRDEAEGAKEKLDGALADGRTLRVEIIARPAPVAPKMGMTLKGIQGRMEAQRQQLEQRQQQQAAASNGSSAGRISAGEQGRLAQQRGRERMERQRPQQAQDDEMEVESTTSAARPQQEIIARPSTSRLRSEQLASLDPRTITQVTPEPIRSVRPERSSNNSSPFSRNQPIDRRISSNSAAPQSQPAPSPSLLSRVGGGTPTNGRPQGPGQGRPQHGGRNGGDGGLLSRLGGNGGGRGNTSRIRSDAMDES